MNQPNTIADDIFAEVVCGRCKSKQWVPFTIRFAGYKILPTGIVSDPKARCWHCPIGLDHTTYTGHRRWKDSA